MPAEQAVSKLNQAVVLTKRPTRGVSFLRVRSPRQLQFPDQPLGTQQADQPLQVEGHHRHGHFAPGAVQAPKQEAPSHVPLLEFGKGTLHRTAA